MVAQRFGQRRPLPKWSCENYDPIESDEAHDIDLGGRGIAPELFKFYGELLHKLSKPVDIVDLSIKSRLNDLVESRGAKIC